MYDILQLNDMILPELREVAEKLKIKASEKLEKQELILKILDAQALNPEAQEEATKTPQQVLDTMFQRDAFSKWLGLQIDEVE